MTNALHFYADVFVFGLIVGFKLITFDFCATAALSNILVFYKNIFGML